MFTALRPIIHSLPPETAHNAGLFALRHGLLCGQAAPHDARMTQEVFGLHFPTPVGLAAGFDKNAYAVDGLLRQGFGFVECGTVTPEAQIGNSKPRVFRLRKDFAVINRLGFNNHGLNYFIQQIQKRNSKLGVAGVNIGKNKTSEDAVADYVKCLEAVYGFADYVTVNVSSPNTEGLRDLQHADALDGLLSALRDCKVRCTQEHQRTVPLLLKVAPDLQSRQREHIAELVQVYGIDGLIVSNTTVSRPTDLQSAYASETGGLSGRPLKSLALKNLAHFYRLMQGRIPLIGVGGISSAEDVYERIRAGATLTQLYTALVYQGFGLIREINTQLPQLLVRDGFNHVRDAVGVDAEKWR